MASESRSMSKEELREVFKVGLMLSIGAILFMLLSFVLVQQETIRLHPKSVDEDTLRGFAERIEFALRYQFLQILFIFFAIGYTIFVRLTSLSLNPLDKNTEDNVMPMRNILTNSIESFLVSAFGQYVFVSFVSPMTVLKYIPLVNIIQFVGRLAFFAGYPLKRAFGFQCTLIPNFLLIAFDIYHLAGFFLGLQ